MAACNITASTPELIAVDLSKERHEILIEVLDKCRRRISILNTLDEFERLINLLCSFQRPVRVAFEATRNYHRAFAFLERFPSPHFIAALSKEAFIAVGWDVIGRKFGKERFLSAIYATSIRSIGLPVAPDSDAIVMFRMVLAEGRSLISQRNLIEARAVDMLKDNSDYQLLTTIPRIGPINALTILAEAGDLRRFNQYA